VEGTIENFEMFVDYDSDRHFSYRNILETGMINL
jgi:uncharacterized membrane protein (DUF373 family)